MEMGIGFLIGILAGAVVAIVAAVIIGASRRAVGAGTSRSGEKGVVAPASPPTQKTDGAAPPVERRGSNTIILGEAESRDRQLNRNIQDVRDLLLRLADVISNTEASSGEAQAAFQSAKDAVDNLDPNESEDLAEAQRVLVREIDRVLTSNNKLHSELDKANQGIAEQRRQIEELRVQARIDGLTRIPNRAAFDERLTEFLALLERTNLVFTLLLVDIDHFKRVNDVYGHVNGDRILRGIASRITDCIRSNDFAARYGGEEFAVIFPGSGANEAMGVAERMRLDIGKTNFRMDDQNIKMTVSGGLAEGKKGMTPDELIAAADAALYAAKNQGRNRMIAHGINTPNRAPDWD